MDTLFQALDVLLVGHRPPCDSGRRKRSTATVDKIGNSCLQNGENARCASSRCLCIFLGEFERSLRRGGSMKLRWSLTTIAGTLMMLSGITGVASAQTQTFYGCLSTCTQLELQHRP